MRFERTPEDDFFRRQRRRAGVRTVFILLGIIIAGGGIYYGIYRILSVRQQRVWARKMDAALSEKNIALAGKWLEDHRARFPERQSSPQFIKFQQQLLELIHRREQRKKLFAQKLANLQKLLDNPAGTAANLPLLLADAAMYADDVEKLAELRRIEAHCRTLARKQELLAAQQAVRELEQLKLNIKLLARSVQTPNNAAFERLYDQCVSTAGALRVKYPAVPAIAEKSLALQKELAALEKKRHSYRVLQQQIDDRFKLLLNSGDAGVIKQRSRDFIQSYPQDQRSIKLKTVLENMAFISLPWAEELQQKIAALDKYSAAGSRCWQRALEKITAERMQGTLFALTVYVKGAAPAVRSFETWEKAHFLPPDSAGIISIKFTARDGNIVAGTFAADGSGKVVYGNETLSCRVRGSLNGTLEEVCWQKLLYKLDELKSRFLPEDFPRHIAAVKALIRSEKTFIPGDLLRELEAALQQAEKALTMLPAQLTMQKNVLKACRKYIPVFAGLIYSNADKKIEFYPSDRVKDHTWLYIMENRGSRRTLRLIGRWSDNTFKPEKAPVLPVESIFAAVILPGNRTWHSELQSWQKSAAEKALKMPELPQFMH